MIGVADESVQLSDSPLTLSGISCTIPLRLGSIDPVPPSFAPPPLAFSPSPSSPQPASFTPLQLRLPPRTILLARSRTFSPSSLDNHARRKASTLRPRRSCTPTTAPDTRHATSPPVLRLDLILAVHTALLHPSARLIDTICLPALPLPPSSHTHKPGLRHSRRRTHQTRSSPFLHTKTQNDSTSFFLSLSLLGGFGLESGRGPT